MLRKKGIVVNCVSERCLQSISHSSRPSGPWESHVPRRTFCIILSNLGELWLSWPPQGEGSATHSPSVSLGTHTWDLATTLGERPGLVQMLTSESHFSMCLNFSRPVLSLQQKANNDDDSYNKANVYIDFLVSSTKWLTPSAPLTSTTVLKPHLCIYIHV